MQNLSLKSLRRLSLGLALGALGLTLVSGCVIVRDDGYDAPPIATVTQDPNPSPSSDVIKTVDIDPGAVLDAAPGDGVGVFVEYQSGGHWTVWTTDVNVGGTARSFDILMTAIDDTSTLSNVVGIGLTDEDDVRLTSVNQAQLLAETEFGADGVSFDTTPGVIIEVDVLIDGASDSRILYWVGDGVLHQGAPTNPVDFWPSAP